MAALLNEIPWSEPLLPAASEPAWEAEMKRRGGRLSEVDRRVAPSLWLREACLGVALGRACEIPAQLFNVAAMVTSQENACRYCYGANRAYLKFLGYSESYIQRIEQDVHLADLDEKERALVSFCRNLARSRPRPSRAELDALQRHGYTLAAAQECALWIALGCFYNRVSILIACPPEVGFEALTSGPKAMLFRLLAPLLRRQAEARRRGTRDASLTAERLGAGPYGAVLSPLAGLPGAGILMAALEGAFASDVVSRTAKALMFGVVARSLGCRTTEAESRRLAAAGGLDDAGFEHALATLDSPKLPAAEAGLLRWVRDTVYIQAAPAQARTRELRAALGASALIEAIGVAALANATVRLAMLVE